MPYLPNGSLTTSKKTIDDSAGWNTQAEWEAYQSASNVDIVNGVVQLATTIIDDFEDGNIGEYSGDTGLFSVGSSPVFNGSLSLDGDRSGTNGDIFSTSGLSAYPEPGYRTTYYMQGDTAGWGGIFYFGLVDASNHYNLTFFDNLRVQIERDGSSVASTSFSGNYVGEWLRAVIDWYADGTIDCSIYESSDSLIASVSTTDNTYGAGGVGFGLTRAQIIDNFHVYWDYVLKEAL